MDNIVTLYWDGTGIVLLDQTRLPNEKKYVRLETVEQVWNAIVMMQVRGAPAIGVTAAYGMVIAANQPDETGFDDFWREYKSSADYLASSRPTAVNLFWAIRRMTDKALQLRGAPMRQIRAQLEREAVAIHREDELTNKKIGEYALSLFRDGFGVLTHCNAGILATTKYGTALSAFYLAKERGMNIRVYADETRPRMQGSMLTAFELMESGIDVTLICDNMAPVVMSQGKIDAVITGCDRVAANGDTANKIGTLGLSIMAGYFGIPMYIAAPTSTIDMDCPDGAHIPIEERDAKEITCAFGKWTAPKGVRVYNPAFDVTPADNITAIVTERGIVYPPFNENLAKLLSGGNGKEG